MNKSTKLSYLKTMLFGSAESTNHDAELSVYLQLTGYEILNWRYSLVPDKRPEAVPTEYEVTQIMACAAGYGHKGAPDQVTHSENGVARTWKHADMVAYVHSHVTIVAG